MVVPYVKNDVNINNISRYFLFIEEFQKCPEREQLMIFYGGQYTQVYTYFFTISSTVIGGVF